MHAFNKPPIHPGPDGVVPAPSAPDFQALAAVVEEQDRTEKHKKQSALVHFCDDAEPGQGAVCFDEGQGAGAMPAGPMAWQPQQQKTIQFSKQDFDEVTGLLKTGPGFKALKTGPGVNKAAQRLYDAGGGRTSFSRFRTTTTVIVPLSQSLKRRDKGQMPKPRRPESLSPVSSPGLNSPQ